MSKFHILPPKRISTTGNDIVSASSHQLSSVGVVSLNDLVGPLVLRTLDGLTLTNNQETGTITLAFAPAEAGGLYVLRNGDEVPGRIKFVPDEAEDPHVRGSGLVLADLNFTPLGGLSGAGGLYFHTDNTDPSDLNAPLFPNTLRIYTGSAWDDILSLSQSNDLYLPLVGGTLTGDLIIGDTDQSEDGDGPLLYLGVRESNPVSPLREGALYYNSDQNIVKVHVGGGTWVGVGQGVQSLTAGAGLAVSGSANPITSAGTLLIDLNHNFLWEGTHTFGLPVVFDPTQTFEINQLFTSGATKGDLIVYMSGSWTRLPAFVRSGDTNTKVLSLDADNDLQWIDGGGNGTLGTPTDASYEDGLFPWTPDTTVANMADDVNELLNDLVPEQADALSSATLSRLSGSTVRTAGLSAGLETISGETWYFDAYDAGSEITTYYAGSSVSYVLRHDKLATAFNVGRKSESSFGTLSHRRYDAAGTTIGTQSYAIPGSGSYPSTTGSLTVDEVVNYNTIWKKANARISYTQSGLTQAGYMGHTLHHTVSGETPKYHLWLDPSDAFPEFATAGGSNPDPNPRADSLVEVFKYLSGVPYYSLTTGPTYSTFRLQFTGKEGIFDRCYNPVHIASVAADGAINHSDLAVDSNSPPAYNAKLVADITVSVNVANVHSNNRRISVTLYRANAKTVTADAAIPWGINTWGTRATQTIEYFVDEFYRLEDLADTVDGGTFDSEDAISNGMAQVRNGALCYPVAADYTSQSPPVLTSWTGDQTYYRYFYKTSASIGSLTFGGITFNQISPHGTGDLNVLLILDDDGLYYDLGLPVGYDRDNRDGSSAADAFGGRINGSGAVVNWSIGTQTTGVSGGGNEARFRLAVIFRDTSTGKSMSITQISSG